MNTGTSWMPVFYFAILGNQVEYYCDFLYTVLISAIFSIAEWRLLSRRVIDE